MAFKIVNSRLSDNHMHTSNYSDGLNSVDEMVTYAGIFGLKEITITDHSQATIDCWRIEKGIYAGGPFWNKDRYKNVINNVEVRFGLEADLLDEKGNICGNQHSKEIDWLILSAHPETYKGDYGKLTEGYENAILKNKERIKCIGHPELSPKHQSAIADPSEHIDIERLTEFANKHNVPLEVNGSDLLNEKSNLKVLNAMLEKAKLIMVNSDAHNLYQLKEARNVAYKYLEDNGFLRN
ncbi:MAG: PHP domain-containing protein [Candidatus ainarchaeum sp.]|nr:PHP domain-containing protein [Candidatus ainarchaeum sp.]